MGSKTDPTRVWSQLFATALLSPLLILAWWLHDSLAFVQETTETGAEIFWPDSQATLNLRVGCPPNRLLTEWGPCWDDAAEDAAARWNAVGAKFRFRIQPPSQQASVACTSNDVDGLTTVVWADTICGKTFNSTHWPIRGCGSARQVNSSIVTYFLILPIHGIRILARYVPA